MKLARGLGRWAGALGWVLAIAPAFALIPASVLDRGPAGSTRFSLFPLAIAVLDPHLWECARNSLIVAVAVTFASRVLGVSLAAAVVREGFRGRRWLPTIAFVGVAAPPAFLALGLRSIFGLEAEQFALAAWIAWFWVAMVTSVPLVAMAAASGLSRFDSGSEDAARLSGASRGKIWRHLVWPGVRPRVARALATVFTMTLIEPGAPLVLGLRRTLGFQIFEAATAPGVGQLQRATVLALAATLIAGLARIMLGRWGGLETLGVSQRTQVTPSRPRITHWSVGLIRFSLFSLAGVAAWTPLVGLGLGAMRTIGGPGESSRGPSLAAFTSLLRDPLIQRSLFNSFWLAIGAVVMALILSRALASWFSVQGPNSHSFVTRVAGLPELFPPLAIGVGVLALPAVLRDGMDSLASMTGHSDWLARIHPWVDRLDSDRTPGLATVLAVNLIILPILARSTLEGRARWKSSRVDAALISGARARRARRDVEGGARVVVSDAFLSFVLAFSNVTPALLFANTSASRTVGPAVMTLLDEPGGGFRQAAALAVLLISLNLCALALAHRERSGFVRGTLQS